MKRSLSLAKTPRDDRHENPNNDRINKNKPRRFLRDSAAILDLGMLDLLESGDVVGDPIEQESTDQCNHDCHDIVECHEERVPT